MREASSRPAAVCIACHLTPSWRGMTDLIFNLLGGIGLFLLGMVLLTDGLRTFAGAALQRALTRFTGTPVKAFFSGALVTAMVQSSSATTVTVIGFVSAGLLTFPQALGVVFGASLGTTGTGWLVATLGLKVSLSHYALPVVGIGGLLKLLGHGRKGALGLALAGFGLIFLGIDTMQGAMAGAADRFQLANLPDSGLQGQLLAMLLGIVLTVLMQSSSAAMAAVLTALHTGVVNFDQAAALTIGAAIGTTVTGALAALGGTVPAKRTALAHVVFNLISGLAALALLPWFLQGVRWAQQHWNLDPGPMSLAAFHTAFIAFGVLLFLPWVGAFARLIERVLPDRGPVFTRHLDRSLLLTPPVALEATKRALRLTAATLFQGLLRNLDSDFKDAASHGQAEAEIEEALTGIQEFLGRIPMPVESNSGLGERRVAQLHAIDHLLRLQPRLRVDEAMRGMLGHPRLGPARAWTVKVLKAGLTVMNQTAPGDWARSIEKDSAALAAWRREMRPQILQETAGGGADPASSLQLLDALHWLDHTGYHAWRICYYLGMNGGFSEDEVNGEALD